MRVCLVQSELKGGWFVDLWSDGTMDVWPFATIMGAKGQNLKLWPNTSFDDTFMVPEFVRHLVYAVRDAHRSTQKLHLSYRLASYSCKRRCSANRGWKFSTLKTGI